MLNKYIYINRNNKRKRVEEINSNATESKRRKGASGKRGRK